MGAAARSEFFPRPARGAGGETSRVLIPESVAVGRAHPRPGCAAQYVAASAEVGHWLPLQSSPGDAVSWETTPGDHWMESW